MIVVLAAVAVGVALPIFFIEARRRSMGVAIASVIPALILIAIGFPLSRLTITVSDEVVRWAFGLGLAKGSVALSEIEPPMVVKTPWYYGFGLRVIPKGMLCNVSGGSAVELHTRRGVIQLGSDEPQKLIDAIEAARQLVQATG